MQLHAWHQNLLTGVLSIYCHQKIITCHQAQHNWALTTGEIQKNFSVCVCVKLPAQTLMQTHVPEWHCSHRDSLTSKVIQQVYIDKVTNGPFHRSNATKWSQVGRDAHSLRQSVSKEFSSTRLRQSRSSIFKDGHQDQKAHTPKFLKAQNRIKSWQVVLPSINFFFNTVRYHITLPIQDHKSVFFLFHTTTKWILNFSGYRSD